MAHTLLFVTTALLTVITALCWRIARRLREITIMLERPPRENLAATTPARPSGSESAGLFAEFLREDPSREQMPKSEQSAAYRKWRREKGLNWKGA